WILWDSLTATQIASGPGTGLADLVAPLFLIVTSGGVEVRALSDGRLVGVISDTAGIAIHFALSSDATYVFGESQYGIEAWGLDGTHRWTRLGNYALNPIVADGAEIRVGNSPAGANVIEHLDASTGAQTTTAFNGQFAAWSLDGQRFVTGVSQNNYRV